MKRVSGIALPLASTIGVMSSTAWAVEPTGNLSKKEVKALIEKAKTPADHLKLAHYSRSRKGQTMGDHCRNLVKYGEGAKKARELADVHAELARSAR